ncbi:MarR family winged helix-turn-helix transcriptional regulator [Microbacterium lacus]|uniref:MarR family winged helix-turn-helix transcriptional regulator n=1 Tax=Microbacterium lacus TaxID=415217 RepID=UPI00384B25B7
MSATHESEDPVGGVDHVGDSEQRSFDERELTSRSGPLGTMFGELTRALAVANTLGDKLLAPEGETVARWGILDEFSGSPQAVPAVARRMRQARQSVQRIADVLVAEGYLRRVPNPEHRRSPLYECTAAGKEVLDRLPSALSGWYAELTRTFTSEEIDQLTVLTRRLRQAAEEFSDKRSRTAR